MINQLTLTWTEAGVRQTQTIQNGQPSKNPGTVRLGRDRAKCDLVLDDRSVSGLHVEIFFNQELQEYAVRNLRPTNPPLVDGKILASGEATLRSDSRIHLGKVQIDVVSAPAVQVAAPQTVLLCGPAVPSSSPPTGPSKYGLQCPKVQPRFALRAVECGVSVVRYFSGGGDECGAFSLMAFDFRY